MTGDDKTGNRRGDGYAVFFALVYPTLLTWAYFIVLAGAPTIVQQGTYTIGKLIQFGFPAVWVVGRRRSRLGWNWPRQSDVLWGTVLGLGLFAGALAIFHLGLKPAGAFNTATRGVIRLKIEGLGVGSVPGYAALALFYSLLHSLLEEYYWRWFVFAQLRRFMRLPTAITLSGVGFMAHHIVIVSAFFGWGAPLSILLSVAVGCGGALWAWIYYRTNSLWAPCISHALVDAAIFAIGYDLAFAIPGFR
jgi:membrane protease YdiL (CAAX protease family)